MDVPASLLVVLVVSGSVLAGCTTDTASPCTPNASSPGAEPVCFLTRDGWVIQAVEWNPNATQEPSVLLVHGFREQHAQYDALALRLADAGYRVLAIDLRAHGESTRYTRGPDPTPDQLTERDVFAMQNDLEAAQRYLGTPPDATVGASVGANLALAHAVGDEGTEALVLLSPVPGEGALDPFPPNRAYPGAVLYAAGEQDRPAAQTASQLADEHEGPGSLHLVDGAAHGTQILRNATHRATVADWLVDRLGEPPAGDDADSPGSSRTVGASSAPPGALDVGAAPVGDAELDPAHATILDELVQDGPLLVEPVHAVETSPQVPVRGVEDPHASSPDGSP